MFTKVHQMLAARRRTRALLVIRQEFAQCGYALDGLADSQIEAALPPGMCETPPDYLGAKTISRALRRLSTGVKLRPGGDAEGAVETLARTAHGKYGYAREEVIRDDS